MDRTQAAVFAWQQGLIHREERFVIAGQIMIVHELYGGILQGLAVTGMISWQQEHLLIGAPATQASLTVQQFLTQNLIWGTWFLLGGFLFCVLAWLARHSLDVR